MRHRKMIGAFVIVCGIAPILLIHRLAMWLDRWLFPSFQETRIRQPLFIIGLPRSGTTLLHRLLAANDRIFTTLPLWELLFAPAICEKRLISFCARCDRMIGRPAHRSLIWVQRRLTDSLEEIHATDLLSPEEDYLALLPYGGCFLRVLASPFDSEVWKLGYFESRMSPAKKDRLIKAYRGVLQRHLYFRGPDLCILSKNPSMTLWLERLASEFDDANFIALRRDPLESVPSQLSSIRSGMSFFGNDVNDLRIVNQFVELLAEYWHSLDRAQTRFPNDRFRLVEYRQLVSNSESVATESLERFGYPSERFDRNRLRQLCASQRRYRSRHHYSLEEFGLTRAQIVRAFATEPGALVSHVSTAKSVGSAIDSDLPSKPVASIPVQ